MQLTVLLQSIEGSLPARTIVAVPWLYPTISALHLLGIALVFGSILPVDLRLLRVIGPQFDTVLASLIRMAMIGFALAATTGALLACVRIADYAGNPAFLAKMLILVAAGSNALVLRLMSRSSRVADAVATPTGAAAAAMSLTFWIAAILAGRWIAFT